MLFTRFLPNTRARLVGKGQRKKRRVFGRVTVQWCGVGSVSTVFLLATYFAAALGRSAYVFETRRQLTERFLTVTSLDTAVLYTSCWPLAGNVDDDNRVFGRPKRDPPKPCRGKKITVFLRPTQTFSICLTLRPIRFGMRNLDRSLMRVKGLTKQKRFIDCFQVTTL